MSGASYVAWSIANAASSGSKRDLGGNSHLAGVIIKGPWTSAFIAFKTYIPDTSTSTNPIDPITDTGAVWDFIRDDANLFITIGTTGPTGNQTMLVGATAARPSAFVGLRYLQAVSVTTSGTTAAPVAANQSQAVTGYFLTVQD